MCIYAAIFFNGGSHFPCWCDQKKEKKPASLHSFHGDCWHSGPCVLLSVLVNPNILLLIMNGIDNNHDNFNTFSCLQFSQRSFFVSFASCFILNMFVNHFYQSSCSWNISELSNRKAGNWIMSVKILCHWGHASLKCCRRRQPCS